MAGQMNQNTQQNNGGNLPPLPGGAPQQTNFGQSGSHPPQYQLQEEKRGLPINLILLLVLLIPLVLIGFFYFSNPDALIFQDVKKLLGVYEPVSYTEDEYNAAPTRFEEADDDPVTPSQFEVFVNNMAVGEFEVTAEGEFNLTSIGGQTMLFDTNSYYYLNSELVAIDINDLGVQVLAEDEADMFTLVDPQNMTYESGLGFEDLTDRSVVIQDPLYATLRYFLTGNMLFTEELSNMQARSDVVFDTALGYPAVEFGATYTFDTNSNVISIELSDVEFETSFGVVEYTITESTRVETLLEIPDTYQEAAN